MADSLSELGEPITDQTLVLNVLAASTSGTPLSDCIFVADARSPHSSSWRNSQQLIIPPPPSLRSSPQAARLPRVLRRPQPPPLQPLKSSGDVVALRAALTSSPILGKKRGWRLPWDLVIPPEPVDQVHPEVPRNAKLHDQACSRSRPSWLACAHLGAASTGLASSTPGAACYIASSGVVGYSRHL